MESDFSPLGRSIGRTSKLVRAWGDRELASMGASVTDWILLAQIANAPEAGMSQIEIARFSDMGGPALVRHLDRLERDGIVVRARDAADRRIMRVTLTDAGRARLAELKTVMARSDERLRGLLGKEEAAVMQAALDKIFDFTRAELFAKPGPPAAAQRSAR